MGQTENGDLQEDSKPLKVEAIFDEESTVIEEERKPELSEAEPECIDFCSQPIGKDSPSTLCGASPRSPFERFFNSGALRRAMRSYGSNLALIQEDTTVVAEDSALDHACWPPAPPGLVPENDTHDALDLSRFNLGNITTEWTVKNTFLDVAPDEPMKLGLRAVKTAGGRLDHMCRVDSSDDEFAHRFA